MMEIDVELVASCPDETSWLTLHGRTQPEHRFMSRSWYAAWAAAYLPMDRWVGPISWLVARELGGNPLAVIPIAHQRWLGLTVTSLAGYYWPFRGIPMVAEADCLLQTCRAIADFVTSRNKRRV